MYHSANMYDQCKIIFKPRVQLKELLGKHKYVPQRKNMCDQCNNIFKPIVKFKEHLGKHEDVPQRKHV